MATDCIACTAINWSIITLCVVTIFFLGAVIWKVISVTQWTQPVYIAMLVLLQLTLVGTLLFFVFQNLVMIDFFIEKPTGVYACAEAATNDLGATILSQAILLNINRWVSYLLRIRMTAGITKHEVPQVESKINRLMIYVNIATAACMLTILMLEISLWIKGCTATDYDNF